MPLHSTGFTSRRALDAPEPVKVVPPALERVLKYNPNHDPNTGRFTSSGGGRRGGTQGPPTTGAFGQRLTNRPAPMGPWDKPKNIDDAHEMPPRSDPRWSHGGKDTGYTHPAPGHPRSLGGGFTSRGALSATGTKHRSVEAAAAAALSGGYGTQGRMDNAAVNLPFIPGRGQVAKPQNLPFTPGEGPKGWGHHPPAHQNLPHRTAESGIFSPSKFTPETLRKNYITMMGKPPSTAAMDKVKRRFEAESQRRYREGVKAYRKARG